jgi:putative permease
MLISDLRRQLVWQDRIKMAFFLGTLVLIGLVTFAVKGLLLSLVIAMIINYVLNPTVARLETRGLSRTLSTTIVFFTFTAIMVLIGVAFSPFVARQISGLQNELPRYIDSTVVLIKNWQVTLGRLSNGLIDVQSEMDVSTWIENQSKIILLNLPQYLSSSASVLLLSPFIGFFLLKDGRRFARSLLEIVPNSIFEMTLNLQYQINDQIAQYIRARILEAAIVGLVVWLGLMVIGFPYAMVLAIFAGVTNLIPYVGPLVGAAPAIVISLTNQDSQFLLFAVIIIYALAQLIDMFVLIPLIVAKIVDLHPVTVIIAVIIGAQLLGVLGMLISIPVFSALKVTFVTVYKHLTDFS